MDQNDIDPDTEGVPLLFGSDDKFANLPDGLMRFAKAGKPPRCDNCRIRAANGLLPACVGVCPAKARKYETPV